MQSFQLTLDDGSQISGRLSLPTRSRSDPTPLLICLHGGTYDAAYYDVDEDHSIDNISNRMHIPVLSVTRPGYGASSPQPSSVEGNKDTYAQRQGKFLNEIVFPALWTEYGVPAGATAVVLLSHSIGSMMATIVAGLHKGTEGYPLAGLITSGIGSELNAKYQQTAVSILESEPEYVTFPPLMKDALMLQLPSMELADPIITTHTEALNKPMPSGEYSDINNTWLKCWHQYSHNVKVPLLYGLSEFDELWISSETTLQEYGAAFPQSPHIDKKIILRAPHCIELSYQGKSWLTECCEFAEMCATRYSAEVAS